MPMTSPDRIALTDTQHGELDRLVRADAPSNAWPSEPASCCRPRTDNQMYGSRHRWVSVRTPPANGGTAGAPHPGCPRWGMRNPAVARRCSLRCRSRRSRHWPAPHRRTAGCRCRNGRARNWPCTPSAAGSARTSRPRLHLRGTDRYVPQQPLGLVQRRPRLHHAAPESMPQHVRMNRPVQLRPT